MTSFFIWLGAWLLISIWLQAVFPKRYDNGYIARFQKKIVTFVVGPKQFSLRWFGFDLLVFVVLMTPIGIAIGKLLALVGFEELDDKGAWIALLLRLLDDYLNGEDDGWKKRWEAVKNKVKWKWTPAMEPAKERA